MIGIFVYTSTSLANLTDISFSFRPSIHQRVALLDHLRVRVALLDHLRVLRVALLDHQKVARAQALLAAYYEKCGEVGVRYEIDEFPDAAEMTV